jgi:hypothetical protein
MIHSGVHYPRVTIGAPQTSLLRPSQIRITSELAIKHNKASLADNSASDTKAGGLEVLPHSKRDFLNTLAPASAFVVL